jgi:glutamate-1-semialdehyde 2,1-aminomutase
MQQMQWGKALSYGTLNAARLPLEVANIGIDVMTADNCEGYKFIYDIGEYLRSNAQKVFDEQGIPAIAQGLGPMFQFYFTEKRSINDVREYAQFVDIKKYQEFSRRLISKGLYVTVSNGLHQCSCLQHTHEDFQEAVGIIEETVKEMKKENLL